jgi:hypothetical protein
VDFWKKGFYPTYTLSQWFLGVPIMTTYGEVGVNVGSVGRWTRFVLGILVILLVVTDFISATHTHSMASYLMMVLSFVGILGIYTMGHLLVGDKLSGKSAWWGTLIFVVPAMFLLIAPEFDPMLQIGYLLNAPELNHPFQLALLAYIGVSFFFQWRAKYGGCEVVTIPNFLFKKDYGSYCVPLLPLDFLEKLIVEKTSKPHDAEKLIK